MHNARHRIVIFERPWLKYLDAPRSREALHRSGYASQTAAGGPIGLRQNKGDVMPCANQRGEGAFGKFRRACEGEAQARAVRRVCAAALRASRECVAA